MMNDMSCRTDKPVRRFFYVGNCKFMGLISLYRCDTMFSMEKTRELYYENAYMAEFDATVLDCRQDDKGRYFVVLDGTAFFPEQGGQSSDTGIIRDAAGNQVSVRHASIKDGVISHEVDAPLETGTSVHGIIDFDHRFSNMQQHTGEHIFSGLVNSKFGYDNVGFHLSDSEVTMDYNGVLTDEDIKEIELKANEAIWRNLEVRCEFPTEEELADIDYRSKKELSGDIRIVTIPGVDVCACCAPHVDRTGEIGILKVISCQNYKGGVRVSILCGKRALEFIDTEHGILKDLTKFLTTGSDKIIDSVKRTADENYALKGELSECREQLIDIEISKIGSDQEDVLLVKGKDLDGNLMRKIVNKLSAEHSGFCGVFAGADSEGYKYIIASGNGGKDLGLLQNMLKNDYGARGGGNKQMIQGSIPGCSITDVIDACRAV